MDGDPVTAPATPTIRLERHGDYYEAFDADASTLSEICGCTQAISTSGRLHAGFPVYQATWYLARCIEAGHQVCIDEWPTPKER